LSIARYVLLTVLLPLAVGMTIRRFLPALAQRASGPANAIGMVLLLVALVPILIAVGPRIVPLMGDGTLVASALVAIAALIGGHLLGGPDPRNRAALAMASAMRHPGIAMMIAGANIPDRRVQAAILGFLLAGIVAAAPYQMWCRRHPHPAIAE
jgi:BASS family bile acid:Na+ symporter